MEKDPYKKALEIVRDALKGYNFLMIGAQAVNSWMVDEEKVRATRDIDFMVDAPEETAVTICQKFRDAGYTAYLKVGKKTDEIPLYIRTISDIYPQVDIIFAVRPWEKNIVANGKLIEDFDIKIAPVEDLIVLKVVAGSNIDLIDIKNLLNCDNEININKLKERVSAINESLLERLDSVI